MCSFSPKTNNSSAKAPDPTKHVNFLLGMVLSDDDFKQEFAYLSGRDQWLACDLLGYGTVCGLDVTVDSDVQLGPRVEVASGVAFSPWGQLIRVTSDQCAYLDDWLADAKVKLELPNHLDSPLSDGLTLYLTLCYRECPTDNVAVPGEPCRTEAEGDLQKPSRIQDDFYLELRWDPPEQTEEDALRDFVTWLRQVKLSDTVPADPEKDLQAFGDALRQATFVLVNPTASPPNPADFLYGSPLANLEIPGSLACEYLRLAFQIWVTEMRPLWRGKGGSCGVPPEEDCVLLSTLHVPVISADSNTWTVDTDRLDPNDPAYIEVVDEKRRPFIVHLRMLQEWLTCGRDSTLTPGDSVEPEMAFDQQPNPGSSELYSRADHTHGTPPNLLPAHNVDPNAHEHSGDVIGPVGDTYLDQLQGVPLVTSSPIMLEAGQVLMVQDNEGTLEWQPQSLPDQPALPNLAGEVTGKITSNRVAKIQTVLVSQDTPQNKAGQVMMLKPPNAGAIDLQWQADDLPLSNDIPSTAVNWSDSTPGDSNELSRANHVHGMPVMNGDVARHPDLTSNKLVVTGIQKYRVASPKPEDADKVLTFTGTQWKLMPATTTGNFVERAAGPYFIQAAGICTFTFNPTKPKAKVFPKSSYNLLRVVALKDPIVVGGMELGVLQISFGKTDDPDEYTPSNWRNYIVKLTPWVTELPFVAFVLGNIPDGEYQGSAFTDKGILIGISVLGEKMKIYSGQLMVEISLYKPDRSK